MRKNFIYYSNKFYELKKKKKIISHKSSVYQLSSAQVSDIYKLINCYELIFYFSSHCPVPWKKKNWIEIDRCRSVVMTNFRILFFASRIVTVVLFSWKNISYWVHTTFKSFLYIICIKLKIYPGRFKREKRWSKSLEFLLSRPRYGV